MTVHLIAGHTDGLLDSLTEATCPPRGITVTTLNLAAMLTGAETRARQLSALSPNSRILGYLGMQVYIQVLSPHLPA